ncbi:MAG: 6-bladed beta-propeller [Tannerella sp.]|jgi:hypothetical protein|nr:6-bladed beta-propeller [Tannerella sp.]
MKKVNAMLVIILLVIMAGCGGKGKQSPDNFITVDVTKSYPKKELILQDFMDVEYIALETNDEFLNQGVVMAIGKQIIAVRNNVRDGDIFIYDRNGKALRKINRMGQGGEEYASINRIVLDEDNEEMFVNDAKRILVYDLYGNYKRSFNSSYGNIYNFDTESFICHDTSFDLDVEETDKPPFVIISKQDGSVIKEIKPACQQKRPNIVIIRRNDMTVQAYTSNFPLTSIIPWHENWILTVYANDTVFNYLPDHSITPFMVRTPSIQSEKPEAFLSLGILTELYWFLQTEKAEPETVGTTPADTRVLWPVTYLMYDRKEKAIYEYAVINDDFPNQINVYMIRNSGANDEIAFQRKIEAYQLVEAYGKGELKGRLKEIAAKLDVEDNPVIMVAKYKK